MSYFKEDIIEAVNAILGEKQVESLGIPRSVEESAIVLFLNVDAHQEAVAVIREALSDLRDFGVFKCVTPHIKGDL